LEIKRKLNYQKKRLKFYFRKYRLVEYKFGSFINFIYKNLLRYLKLYRKKVRMFRYFRFKNAVMERRVNRKIILPKPIITRRR
jgi:hypothetical protein